MLRLHIIDALAALIIPGGFFQRSLFIYLSLVPRTCVMLPHVPFLPLYASIWLKFWPSWVAWLLCLCPTFPLIRLGHKGSTSAIVTDGSAGCVPQTGWSRKLAFLREYSVGEQKMTFIYCNTCPQMFISCISFRSSDMHINACVPRERNPQRNYSPWKMFLTIHVI